MSSFVYVVLTVFFTLISWSWAIQEPCYNGGCHNLTVFLGPKWGTKVIHLPNHPNNKTSDQEKTKEINVNSTSPYIKGHDQMKNISNEIVIERHEVAGDGEPLIAKHRPIPDDDSVFVDYMGADYLQPSDDYDIEAENASGIRALIDNENVKQHQGILNLSALSLSGVDVKLVLASVTMEELEQVSRLYLTHNTIHDLPALTFPEEMEYRLVELHLEDNPLMHISTNSSLELSRLSHIQVLNLSRTSLRYLGSLYLPSLETLDLSNNMLTDLPSLGGMPKLRHLNLNSNHITVLFGTYSNIRELNVANNKIFHIVYASVRSMSMLEEIYLNNNSMRTIELDDRRTNYAVYMSGNPLECDCALQGIMRDRRSEIKDWDNLTCHNSIREEMPVTWFVERRCHRQQGLVRLISGPGPVSTHSIHFGQHYSTYNLKNITFTLVNIILFLTVVVLVAQKVRRYFRVRCNTKDVPYDILVDKPSVWVCSENEKTGKV